MLMFHDGRMGLGPTGVCRAPLWPPPPPHWFAPHRSSAMTEVIDDVRSVPPGSPQSDTDSSHSSALSDYRCVDASYYGGYHVAGEVGLAAPSFPCRWRACADCFNSLDALSSHVAANHADVTGGLFYCGWEGCARGHRGFNARYKMLVHVRTHTNERPHKCAQCDKSFSRAENLKIHTRSHSGEKPYVCPVQGCNKAYSNSSDRFKHTRTHSVDKPYCCKIAGCQKRYTDPSSLRKHVKTYKHTSVSPKHQENDTDIKKSDQNEVTASRLSHDDIHQSEVRNFESSSATVRSTASLSENESYEREVKHFQRKYSYSESDRPVILENEFKVQYRSHIPADNLQDESDRLCFCKDLPCIHTRRYVNPEYISVDSLPYTCQIQSPKLTFTGRLSTTTDEDVRKDRYFVSEPLNLKRCSDSRFEEIYENGVLNLEKKAKTEFIDKTVCLDTPLDLSNKKTL